MRIGIEASNIRFGGGVTHLIELLGAARPAEFGIAEVIVWSGRETLARMPKRSWLRLVHEPLLDRRLPWRLAWQLFRLPRLAAESCDVVFTPGASQCPAAQPYVTMCQNMLPFEPLERRRFGWSWIRIKLWILGAAQCRSFRRADGVIFLTRFARDLVGRRIGGIRVPAEIISHGIGNEFRCAPRSAVTLREYSYKKPFHFLYVSIVSVYKHQESVAEAVAKLRREGFPVAIDFAGPAFIPALRRLLKRLQQLDPKSEFIRYIGPIEYGNLPDLYHRADAFVFASSCENLPIILLEAMASGLPIACSDRGPMPEILGEEGVFFDPEQPDSIAEALRSFLMDPSRRDQAAKIVFERSRVYTWEKCARETFRFIAHIARIKNGAKR